MSDPVLKIAVIFSRLVNYLITQVHACREEKVMAKVDEEQDENDRGSDRGKLCFVGPPLTFLHLQLL